MRGANGLSGVRYGRAGLAALLLVSTTLAGSPRAIAQAEATRAQLLDALRQRDAVIADLVRRVENLEKKAGIAPIPQAKPTTAETAPASAADTATVAQTPDGTTGDANADEPAPSAAETAAAETETAERPRGPGQFEVDEDAAERALERTLVTTGALLLPAGQIEIAPELTYNRFESQRPVLITGLNPNDPILVANEQFERDELIPRLTIQAGLPFDSQIEVSLPFVIANEEVSLPPSGAFDGIAIDNVGTGTGNVSLGFAKTLLREDGAVPDLIGRVTWEAPLGSGSANGVELSDDFHRLRGSITAIKRQDPLVYVGRLGYNYAFENGNQRPGDSFSLSLAALLAVSPETSLRLGLDQTFAQKFEVAGRSIPGTGGTSSVLNIGLSSILGRNTFLNVNAAIGLTDDAPDYGFSVSIPFRYNLNK